MGLGWVGVEVGVGVNVKSACLISGVIIGCACTRRSVLSRSFCSLVSSVL